MSPRLETAVSVTTALGCGLSAGVFFAFSTFVMPALGRLPVSSGVAAMQAINVAAIEPVFLGVLFGSGIAASALAVGALARRSGTSDGLVVAAAVVYVLGTLGTTIACNVPLNDALAAVTPGTDEAAALFARYLVTWTAWNHVRAGAATLAAALLVLAAIGRTSAPQREGLAARATLALAAR